MDYGEILSRSWNIIWTHKFLIILGVLVALGSGLGSGTSSGINFSFDRDTGDMPFGPGPMPRDRWQDADPFAGMALPIGLVLFLVVIGLAVALVVWVIATLARGGLIAGVGTLDAGGTSSFGQAWAAGWQRGWTLLGIGIVPALPALLLLLVAGLGLLGYGVSAGMRAGVPRLGGLAAAFGLLACVAIPVALVLDLLRTFANRACMLEGLGVIDSYRRGLSVLGQNLGSALVLFLIQVALIIIMGILLFVPGALLALCCLFWPVLVLVQGAVTAYFSTMWTLAWRSWTAKAPTAAETAGA